MAKEPSTKRTRSARKEASQLPVPMTSPEIPSALAAFTRLKEELAQQTAFGFTQITAEINHERRERERLTRIINVGLAGIGILLVVATIVILSSIGSNMRDTLALEMATLTSTTAQTIRAGTEPVRETVDRQTEAMARAAQIERALVSVYGYEHLATTGSKLAFTELRKLAARKDDAGLIARDRLQQIHAQYKFLELPQRGNIRVADLQVVRAGVATSLDSLSSRELVYVLNAPGTSLAQIHRGMSLLWDRPFDKDLERELWSSLQTSNNLPAAVATCSLLKKQFGTRLDMFDFDGWRAFLAKRL